MFRPRRWRHLKQRVEAAQGEADRSRRELEQTREQVVRPSRRLAEQNHFAALIRDSLLEGGDRR